MKELSIDSSIYDNAYLGKYKGKDVVVFGDGEDLFAYVKESVVNEDAKKVWKYKGVLLVDSDFVNSCKGKLPNSELKHAGGGNFFLQTPDGVISFDRTNGPLDGMGGRAHQVSDNQGGKLLAQLIKKMGAKIVNESINEARSKKVTKQMWDKMDDDTKIDALLSVVKDPDDAEKYFDKKWDELPSGFERDMTIDESVVNEAEITSDDQFKEYATALLKKAFGADYDEAKAMEVVDGLTAKYDGDYGAMVGALQSSIG